MLRRIRIFLRKWWQCRTKTCTYYRHYLAYGPADLTHVQLTQAEVPNEQHQESLVGLPAPLPSSRSPERAAVDARADAAVGGGRQTEAVPAATEGPQIIVGVSRHDNPRDVDGNQLCEDERGDRPGGEGPRGTEPAVAMGSCGCQAWESEDDGAGDDYRNAMEREDDRKTFKEEV